MAKILLVEDDKSLREIYGVRLQAEGYTIISAGDGEEALAFAIKERPDLIVSDVMMPKISGFDMLDILRSTTETKGIKVIMMTALSSDDQRARGEQLGADRYLVKSQVGIEDVVRAVHEVIGDSPRPPQQNTFAPPAPSAVPRPAPASPVQPAAAPPAPDPAAQPSVSNTAPVAPAPTPPVAAAPPVAVAMPQQPVAPPSAQVPAQPAQEVPAPQPFAAPQPQPQPAPVSAPAAAPASSTAPEPFSLPQPTAPFSTPRPAGLADRIIEPINHPEPVTEPIADRINRELNTGSSVDFSASDPAPSPPSSGLNFEETPRNPFSSSPPPAA